MQLPRNFTQISIWRGRLYMLDINTPLNSLKTKWIQRLLNTTNALWKYLMLYRLNLLLNSNQDLAHIKKNKFSALIDTKICTIRIMKISLFSYLVLYFNNNNIPAPTSTEEFLDQPIFLKSTYQIRLQF